MSNYLLDTNIISEIRKKQPDKNVINWISSISQHSIYISVITLGEIYKGIEIVKDSSKKQELVNWVERELKPWFGNKIVDVDSNIAQKWGSICAIQNIPAIDALIAASAMINDLILVTRNIKDFQVQGLKVLNPFKSVDQHQ